MRKNTFGVRKCVGETSYAARRETKAGVQDLVAQLVSATFNSPRDTVATSVEIKATLIANSTL